MTRQSGQRKPKSRHRRLVGAGATVGAFLTFGLTPTVPSAHGDADLDWLVDLFTPAAGMAAD